jgi:hypothetical protein
VRKSKFKKTEEAEFEKKKRKKKDALVFNP